MGHHIVFGGGAAASYGRYDLACAAQDANGDTVNGATVMITDKLPRLDD